MKFELTIQTTIKLADFLNLYLQWYLFNDIFSSTNLKIHGVELNFEFRFDLIVRNIRKPIHLINSDNNYMPIWL